jgi:hypothetical protein
VIHPDQVRQFLIGLGVVVVLCLGTALFWLLLAYTLSKR